MEPPVAWSGFGGNALRQNVVSAVDPIRDSEWRDTFNGRSPHGIVSAYGKLVWADEFFAYVWEDEAIERVRLRSAPLSSPEVAWAAHGHVYLLLESEIAVLNPMSTPTLDSFLQGRFQHVVTTPNAVWAFRPNGPRWEAMRTDVPQMTTQRLACSLPADTGLLPPIAFGNDVVVVNQCGEAVEFTEQGDCRALEDVSSRGGTVFAATGIERPSNALILLAGDGDQVRLLLRPLDGCAAEAQGLEGVFTPQLSVRGDILFLASQGEIKSASVAAIQRRLDPVASLGGTVSELVCDAERIIVAWEKGNMIQFEVVFRKTGVPVVWSGRTRFASSAVVVWGVHGPNLVVVTQEGSSRPPRYDVSLYPVEARS